MRVAIVTGAAQGIGRRTAEVLGEAGYKLLLLDVQPCEATLSALRGAGCEAEELIGDITDEAMIARAAALVMERWGRADVLVNNAGISFIAPAETIEASAFRRVLEVNLKDAAEGGGFNGLGRSDEANACVVDEDVGPPPSLHDGGDSLRDQSLVGDVSDEHFCFRANSTQSGDCGSAGLHIEQQKGVTSLAENLSR